MMAKRKEDRYNDVEELLEDLDAISTGQTPLQAHKRFDVTQLGKLEDGEIIESEEDEEYYQAETIAHYRVVIVILSIVAGISLLGAVVLLISLMSK
jgi:hypothetical protein